MVVYQGLCTGRRNIQVDLVTSYTFRRPNKLLIEPLNPHMQIPTQAVILYFPLNETGKF